ncbi:uncharacterized protein LOC116844319 [Odontomachus brunneus]|uniref:uncharacterized protein LOC116844319 n=1 Tax=Odontomachus brunneus TaxID=486640 RepID=UPI0013F1B942|nr:uncharacterized protein LOC116844319 [Odontomachus brunneus]
MWLAMEKINPGEFRIGEKRSRATVTGALVLEIPGLEGHSKADALAAKMSVLLKGGRACGAFREEDGSAGPRSGRHGHRKGRDPWGNCGLDCGPEAIKVGSIKHAPNETGTLWPHCLLTVAQKITGGSRLKVGWSSVCVEAITQRPLQ